MSLSTEQKLLSALVSCPAQIFDIDEIVVGVEDFQQESHKCIYRSIKEIAESRVDLEGSFSISEAVLEEKIARNYPQYYKQHEERFRKLIDKLCPGRRLNNADLQHIIKDVLADSFKKQIGERCDNVVKEVQRLDNPGDIIETFESQVLQFTNNALKSTEIEYVGSEFEDWIEDGLERLSEDGKIEIGIQTGFPQWCECIGGGLREGSVNFLCARAKFGKSFVAVQMADYIAQQGIPVLYLDTELSNRKQAIRRCAQYTGIKLKDIEQFSWAGSSEQIEQINDYKQYIKKNKIHYLSIKGWSIQQQVSAIRRFYSQIVKKGKGGRWNRGVVVLDYLKLMNPNDKGAEKEYEALGYRMTALHDLMFECNNPMIMFGQQNREGVNSSDETTVAGSDRITWLCDNFTIMTIQTDIEMAANHNDDDNTQNGNVKFKVVLSRDGSGTPGRQYISVYADIHDAGLGVMNGCGKFREIGLKTSPNK